MRAIFSDRVRLAGYPKRLFSFHSLRSGFLCAALLKAGKSESAKKAVLEYCAYVAGWKVGGPS